MASRYGRCSHFGSCGRADSREMQSVPDGSDFVCQECGKPLTAVAGRAPGGAPFPTARVIAAAAVAVGVVAAAVAGVALFRSTRSAADPGRPPVVNVPVLRLSGSNTIGAQLGPDLAEAWLRSLGTKNLTRAPTGPDETRVSGVLNGTGVSIEVRAHGSATAFTDLAAGACDIGMASRQINAKETADLRAKGLGDLTGNSSERVIGLDGVAIVVHETNPIDSLDKSQVAAIFTGTSTGRPWNLYARDDKSGTYDTFKDRVLGGKPMAKASRFEDSRQLVAAVANDKDGIGFVGLPYATGVKVLRIADRGAMSLAPNTMTVRTESYPLSRRLFLYVPDSAKPAAREFADFATSPAGQDVVDKAGFVGQQITLMPPVAPPPDAPSDYIQLVPHADRLSVDLRFRTGSSILDPKGYADVKRIAAAMSGAYQGRGVMLIGFADSTGARRENQELSKARAEAVEREMRGNGINPVLVTGFGQDMPVADNQTDDGREKNRRVEVWLRK